mmetsp:Transcript_55903/g.93115  ORF Transcript_55903/g.93115 Transcript_55903/m.93115 type:complete len:294 (+) Transcript_55903:121-1002(+)
MDHKPQQTADTVLAMIGTAMFIVLATCHLKASWQRWHSYPHRLSLRLSIILVMLGCVSIAVLHLFTFARSQSLCRSVLRYISLSPYIAFKTVTYLIVIHRRYLIFKEHPRFHQPVRLKCCGVMIAWWSFFNIVWLRYATHVPPHCSMHITPVIDSGCLVSVVMCDLLAFTLVLCCYVRPYKQLKYGADEQSQRLFKMNEKHCILSISAVLCICITILFAAAFAMFAMWFTFNVLISSFAVVLMFEWNDKIAGKVCICCYTPMEQYNDDTGNLVLELAVTTMTEPTEAHENDMY